MRRSTRILGLAAILAAATGAAQAAEVEVRATLVGGNDFDAEALYLVVRASTDFSSWWRANEVRLPREITAGRLKRGGKDREVSCLSDGAGAAC